ncbi:isoprenyl transferase [Fundicoccus culcitae]|uniref:Isoprenyl transferase n=1 Tax=Fundicoccus culcitae TaxID=2969821 RepID=A0ABY5P7I9_9LACT|nr:isoprenyl transferase [Fundicoccus culcitae]UUX34639.1 isoprenyl transferase [Fundicoccus culcitae]
MAFDKERVPKHIAIIMDGNGRWAKKRFLPRVAGHRKGVETIKKVTIRANELGVKLLTVYAFSTENWGRPQDEVNYLMSLPKDFFDSFLPELIKNDVRVEWIGDITALPQQTYDIVVSAVEQTKHCQGMVLNFALNYGGRQEITDAVVAIAQAVSNQELETHDITPELIESHLSTARYGQLAAPDLLIRTSGEQRLSNFLLWQAAYSEFYFTDVLWPDFGASDLDAAVESYIQRDRRFGKVKG